MSTEVGPRMTCVFAYNVRKFEGSPFKVETPFGSPITISCDDAFARSDQLQEALEAILEACSNTTYPTGHPIWRAFELADAALGYERRPTQTTRISDDG